MVRLTDRHDMTILFTVDIKQQNNNNHLNPEKKREREREEEREREKRKRKKMMRTGKTFWSSQILVDAYSLYWRFLVSICSLPLAS